jgi:1,4-alpha-glucan branching enzyme
MKEVERRLNEILKQISSTGIRRKKMEQKSSEKTEPKTKKVRFNLYVPGTKRVFLAKDFNGCALVIPEGFGVHKNITLYQERFPEYHL